MKKSLLTLLFGIIIGFIIGWFSNKAHRGRDNTQDAAVTEVYRDTITDTIPYMNVRKLPINKFDV